MEELMLFVGGVLLGGGAVALYEQYMYRRATDKITEDGEELMITEPLPVEYDVPEWEKE